MEGRDLGAMNPAGRGRGRGRKPKTVETAALPGSSRQVSEIEENLRTMRISDWGLLPIADLGRVRGRGRGRWTSGRMKPQPADVPTGQPLTRKEFWSWFGVEEQFDVPVAAQVPALDFRLQHLPPEKESTSVGHSRVGTSDQRGHVSSPSEADFKVMIDLAAITHRVSAQRIENLKKLVDQLQSCNVAVELFEAWGLTLSRDVVRLTARQADGAQVMFNKNTVVAKTKTLPTLPFQVLHCLLEILPPSTEEGRHLRRAMIECKAIHFILACLAVFTHQPCDPSLVPGLQHELLIAATKAQGGYEKNNKSEWGDNSHVYWPKGTGYGSGSTAQSWNIELALQKKRAEEEHVTCLLQVLSSYIDPLGAEEGKADIDMSSPSPSSSAIADPTVTGTSNHEDGMNLPEEMAALLRDSCLFSTISGYLKNDSVLDMARHVPLYKSILQFLGSLVTNSQLLPLLVSWESKASSALDEQSISSLLVKMKDVVDRYTRRLTVNTKREVQEKQSSKLDDLEDYGLARLISDIQSTAVLVDKAVSELINKQGPQDVEMRNEGNEERLAVTPKTLEERYIEEMKKLQFAFFEIITEEGLRFSVPYHYESNVRSNWGRSLPARLKRLAQENVTLSSSLPLAYGSTIFVRCDNDRLDVVKVLITGPSDTPYSNGCFEFDVFFPNDYPSSPMMINLETTGRQRIRFNPNLYNDGKVCLSILNTWDGRPEERWNPQTSSLLPVLVAIQSLILNEQPYFNEPGYQTSHGTELGEKSSRQYSAGIMIATVEWAMLDQIRNSSPCFKDVIHSHFWMKKSEIISQCDKWLDELVVTYKADNWAGKDVTGGADPVEVFKKNSALLKEELLNMKPPEGLKDLVSISPRKSPSDDSVASGGGTSTASPFKSEKRTYSQVAASACEKSEKGKGGGGGESLC